MLSIHKAFSYGEATVAASALCSAACALGCGGSADLAESTSPPARFIAKVELFAPGPCAGFGASQMPSVIQGPPKGAGSDQGSLNVLSLGTGGEIILSFGKFTIVDELGPDFIVYENPFYRAGTNTPVAELGEVSVSRDGVTWLVFPCHQDGFPFAGCAGRTPVISSPENGISPFDTSAAGGDAFDLASLGLTEAAYVRIRDLGHQACQGSATTNGFDLDAIAIVHAGGGE